MMKLISALIALSLSAAVLPATAQTEGEIVPPDEVPSDIPEWHRQEFYQYPALPDGWSHAVPTGGAITTSGENGKLEISSFQLMCDVPGQGKQTIISDTQNIIGGTYLRNPWFGNNDYSEVASVSRTSEGTVIMDVPPNRVLHWWTTRTQVPAGTKDCSVEAVVRGSGNVIAYVGANWWKSFYAMWAGFNVNNKEIGNGDWYHAGNGEWRVIRIDP